MSSHQLPVEGGLCQCCYSDIDSSNYVEYRGEDEKWYVSGYCQMCVEYLLSSQWSDYVTRLQKTTCKAEQRRMLARGPPEYLRDEKMFMEVPDSEVRWLWYMSDSSVKSARLEGALEGEERMAYWNEQRAFYVADDGVDPEDEVNTDSVE